MSRIGRKPIVLPAGVEFSKKDNVVTVKGPLGQLQKAVPQAIDIKLEDNQVIVSRRSDNKRPFLHGLTRTLMPIWLKVSQRFHKTLNRWEWATAAKQATRSSVRRLFHPVNITPPKGVDWKSRHRIKLS